MVQIFSVEDLLWSVETECEQSQNEFSTFNELDLSQCLSQRLKAAQEMTLVCQSHLFWSLHLDFPGDENQNTKGWPYLCKSPDIYRTLHQRSGTFVFSVCSLCRHGNSFYSCFPCQSRTCFNEYSSCQNMHMKTFWWWTVFLDKPQSK